MHRKLFLLFLLASLPAAAQTLPGKVIKITDTVTCTAGVCTRAAPTTSDTSGIAISNQVTAIRLRVCAASGQTLSGGGTIDVYGQDEEDGLWTQVFEASKTITASASGKRCTGFFEFNVGVPYGRILFAANGVTNSGGNLFVKHYVAVLGK